MTGSLPRMRRSTSSFCTPFWSDRTAVFGPTIGEMARAAVSVSQSSRIVGHAYLWEADIAKLALDDKPPLAQRREMSAACNEAHLAPSLSESCPEVTTNTP